MFAGLATRYPDDVRRLDEGLADRVSTHSSTYTHKGLAGSYRVNAYPTGKALTHTGTLSIRYALST